MSGVKSFIGILLTLWVIFLNGNVSYGDDDNLFDMEKYTLAESLEFGIQPIFFVWRSPKIDHVDWFNLTMTHTTNRDTGLKLSLGYLSYDVVQDAYGSDEKDQTIVGQLRQMTLRATLLQNLSSGSDLIPYFGYGLNFYRTFDEIPERENENIWVESNNTWGLHLTTGFKYHISRNISISGDIYRDWARGNFKVQWVRGSTQQPSVKIDLDAWSIGVNLSLRF